MSKEPFTIDRLAVSNAEHECEIGEPGDATLDELGAQIHAHDPSLPETLEEQLRELLARPTEGEMRLRIKCAFATRQPSVESILDAVAQGIGRPLVDADAELIIATMEAIHAAIKAAVLPEPPSIMPPSEPPPPPPKAVEGES